MELNKAASIILIGVILSSPAYAERFVFGSSGFEGDSNDSPDNGLNITTTAGNFFVATSSSGWWNSEGAHKQINTNYIAGVARGCCGSDANFNNFFTFDLSNVTGSVLSASLTLNSWDIVGPGPLDYSLFDITSPLPEVRATATGNDLSIYNDLMSGSIYGSFSYTEADENKLRSIVLNSIGISALNGALGGEFGIGGSVAPIPEPETYAMLLAGLGLIGWVAYRRKSA
ncbi:hypothetical protein SQ11_03675 [Nitrosospira sp. NpAV]|nr:hypothetical protein SQ11_03675 [Nitrosospira sp. NpAV]